MDGNRNGDWHGGHHGSLPLRPPTVDEAIPYSPFTSIVPFAPDIIPFPSAEPPTPPTTLNPEQQTTAKRVVGELNDEAQGRSGTSYQLENTLRELRSLLNPNELSEFRFKPIAHIATPPPEPTAQSQTNGAPPSHDSLLSPFAKMLLGNTAIAFVPPNADMARKSTQNQTHAGHNRPHQKPRTHLQHHTSSTTNGSSFPQAGDRISQLSTPPTAASSTPARAGPAVVIPQGPANTRRDEYQKYDLPEPSASQKKIKSDNEPVAFKSREREIADRKIAELRELVNGMIEDKDTNQTQHFTSMEVDDAEVVVLQASSLAKLSEAVSKVVNLGSFPDVSSSRTLAIQSLCDSLITATGQSSLHLTLSDEEDAVIRLARAQSGLRACRLVLTSMIEGKDDKRICSEDRVQGIVRLVKHTLNSCITPVVEARRSGSDSELFELASRHRQEVQSVLRLCSGIFTQLASLLEKVRLSDFTLSPIEAVAMDIVFALNGEKEADSALGVHKFELFRQKAMDVLAQIFAHYREQRDSITGEILNNLGRVPVKGTNVRPFKSSHESPLMLVSVLFMRIVHAAASSTSESSHMKKDTVKEESDAEGEDDSDFEEDQARAKKQHQAGRSFGQIASRLYAEAKQTAVHIANTLVTRAENVSKSGEKPFRLILDNFIDDLCSVLGSPEWPAASILLEQLLAIMLVLAKNDKKDKGVQVAEMAVASMGRMGLGIIAFTHRLKQTRSRLDISQSAISSKLVPLADDALNSSINGKDLLALGGPFRIIVESLPTYVNPQGLQASRDDPQLRCLRGCHVTMWANAFHEAHARSDAPEDWLSSMASVDDHLRKLMLDSKWSVKQYKFQDVLDTETQLASGIVTLQDLFCKYLQNLIIRLLFTTQSQSAKLKSGALTYIEKIVSKDPAILDEKTFRHLAKLIEDQSSLVRGTTITLIQSCLERDPSLQQYCLHPILKMMTDSANEPKKKAIRLLKNIYLNAPAKQDKVLIAKNLLLPLLDDDKIVAELTHQIFESIWLDPLRSSAKVDENQLRLAREKCLSLIVETVDSIRDSPVRLKAFELFFTNATSPTAKNHLENVAICKQMVADMADEAGTESKVRTLQTLSMFAKVNPRLFTMDQIQLFKTYINNFTTTEDVVMLRATTTIFRLTIPAFPALQERFLEDVRGSLAKVVPKLGQQTARDPITFKDTLVDVAHCSWIIAPLIKGSPPQMKSGMDKLFTMIVSTVIQLEPRSQLQELSGVAKITLLTYMLLLGVFAKVCKFDDHVDLFNSVLTTKLQEAIARNPASRNQMSRLLAWQADKSTKSVTVLFLTILHPFVLQKWDHDIREQALCSIGEVCQQKTKHFTRENIVKAFKLPFMNEDVRLIKVALAQFRDFLAAAERRSDTGAAIAVGEGAVHGAERLESSYAATDNDHATSHIAQTFRQYIIDVALKRNDELALTSTEILVSINRQGLLHPKECGPALVALSTSRNSRISQVAGAEHRKIHLQHETMFEKEYVTAVGLAFEYQRDVFQDPRGALPTETSFRPKLHQLFDAFKAGSRKTLKNFVTNISRQMNFDLVTLKTGAPALEHALFVRFCLENIAFFDYGQADEVIHAILTLESIVLKQTGPSVALAIETEMPEQQFQTAPAAFASDGMPLEPMPQIPNNSTISEERLRHLTVASIILHMMWDTRTLLRRAYNLQKKLNAKDVKGTATRIGFVTGKDLWERFSTILTTLDAVEAMRKQCAEFAEIINVDREHAVEDVDGEAGEQVAQAAAGYETPEEDGEGEVPTSGKGRKRRGSAPIGNTPKKHRGRPAGSKIKGKRNSKTPDDSD